MPTHFGHTHAILAYLRLDLRRSSFHFFNLRSSAPHQRHLRPQTAVKREDVMRDDLMFHVLRITLVANSANIAAETLSQARTTSFSKQRRPRGNGCRLSKFDRLHHLQ